MAIGPQSGSFMDQFLEDTTKSPDWIDLRFNQKHIDEQIVEMALEQFEDDLQTLLDFVDVGERPAFHIIPTPDVQIARWQDPGIKQELIQAAMQSGGPKAVTDLLDQMAKMEATYWRKLLSAPMPIEGGS